MRRGVRNRSYGRRSAVATTPGVRAASIWTDPFEISVCGRRRKTGRIPLPYRLRSGSFLFKVQAGTAHVKAGMRRPTRRQWTVEVHEEQIHVVPSQHEKDQRSFSLFPPPGVDQIRKDPYSRRDRVRIIETRIAEGRKSSRTDHPGKASLDTEPSHRRPAAGGLK